MSGLVDFFTAILNFCQVILNYFVNLCRSLLAAVETLAIAPSFGVYLIGFLPTLLGVSMTLVISVGVIKMLVGWGNS